MTTRQVTQAYGASSQSALVQVPASLIASYEGKLLHLSETVKEDSNLRNICSIPPKGSQRFVATEMEPFPMGWPASRRSRAFAPGHEGCLHVAHGVFARGMGDVCTWAWWDVCPTDGGLLCTLAGCSFFPWLLSTPCFLILLALAMPFPASKALSQIPVLAEALNPQLRYCL